MRKLTIAMAGLLCAAVFFTACTNNVPEHAKYIPSDAVMVAGINTKEMGKDIAWEAIKGSDLYKKIMGRMKDKDSKDFENSGIDWMSTSYFCVRPGVSDDDKSFVAILPVKDTKKLEAFMAETFDNPQINTVADRKETMLDPMMFAGWNDDVLIITSDKDAQTASVDIERLFNTKENKAMLADDERFAKLEKEGHDITLWMNYENMMSMMPREAAQISSSFMQNMVKGSAMAAGLDFEKGAIEGNMRYYASKEWEDVYKKFSEHEVDESMVKRLPSGKLNLLIAGYMAPDGLQQFFEKSGTGGFINMALSQSGITIQEILKAFSGEMVVAVSDAGIDKDFVNSDTLAYDPGKPEAKFMFAMKIGEEQSFNKVFGMLSSEGKMQPVSANTYVMKDGGDNFYLSKNEQYVLVTNNQNNGEQYLSRSSNADLPAPVKERMGKPWLMYFDVNGLADDMGERGKILKDIDNQVEYAAMSGGDFKNGYFNYDMKVEMANKKENSLLVLIDMASANN